MGRSPHGLTPVLGHTSFLAQLRLLLRLALDGVPAISPAGRPPAARLVESRLRRTHPASDLLIGALPHRRGRFCDQWHAIWRPAGGRVVDDMVERFTTGDIVRLNVTGVMDGHRQTVVHLVPAPDAERYATEFSGQLQTIESLDNKANACRYSNTALALANAALAEPVLICPRCQYPTHRLITYPGGSQLGPCCAFPPRKCRKDQETLAWLRRVTP